MDNLKKQLENHRIPVTKNEWNRLEKKLDGSDQGFKTNETSYGRKWTAVAATLLLLVSAYLVFQWPSENGIEMVEIIDANQPQPEVKLASADMNVLAHRKSISEESTLSGDSKRGLIPYLASLPNGEKWLVQLSLIRDTEKCIAEIHSINDRPFPVNMRAGDDKCLVFSSDKNNASLKLMDEGEKPVLLLVLNQMDNGQTFKEIELELRPVL